MDPSSSPHAVSPWWSRLHWTVWCLFAAAVVLMIVDHWAHMLGVLPYLLLLACPLMHLFMHGKHGHANHHDDDGGKRYQHFLRSIHKSMFLYHGHTFGDLP